MQVWRQCSVIITLVAALAGGPIACDSKPQASSAPVHETASPRPQTAPVPPASRPMMIVFSRDYCTPCQIMKPWVAEVASETPGLDVVTVNVDRKKHEHIGSFFKITSVPTLVYARADGHVVKRTDGLARKKQMTSTLRELGWAQ